MMKKKYVKPHIFFDNFSLSEGIGGSCESIVGNATKGNCAVVGTGDIYMFNDAVYQCEYNPEDMGGKADEWDGFCYHVPTEYNNLFNS